MIKHLSVVFAVLFSFGIASYASAQDTPQSAIDAGDFAKAISLLETQASDATEDVAIAGIVGQAQLALEQKQLDKAEKLIASLDEKRSALKKKNGWIVVSHWLDAELARAKEDHAACKSSLKAAMNAIEAGAKVDDAWQGIIQYSLAVIEDNNSDAREYAEAAIDALHGAKMTYEEALAHLRLADLEWARDKQRRAFKSYESAIKAFENCSSANAKYKAAEATLLLASKYIEADDKKHAVAKLKNIEKSIEAAGNPAELMQKLDEVRKLAE